jgi:hypothetical protein
MRRAVADINRWLDRLALEVSTSQCDARSRRGLLAVELQTVIDQVPLAFLNRQAPRPLVRQLAARSATVVPAASPTYMPTQSLEPALARKPLSHLREMFGWLRQRSEEAVSPQAGV